MKVFLIVLAVLLFLLLAPVVLKIHYQDDLLIRAGFFGPLFKIYPLKEKKPWKKIKQKSKAEKQSEKASETNPEARKIDRAALWKIIKKSPDLIKLVLTVHKLRLNIWIGNEDPGDLALAYGGANALVELAAAVLSPIFPLERWNVRIIPDFERTSPEIQGEAVASTSLARILFLLIYLAFSGILTHNENKGDLKNG